jgi:hypothetical protein
MKTEWKISRRSKGDRTGPFDLVAHLRAMIDASRVDNDTAAIAEMLIVQLETGLEKETFLELFQEVAEANGTALNLKYLILEKMCELGINTDHIK